MACTLDKMLIKGIRSFSPDNQAVIEFYRPLTLIVGHNGAGKTTVIECLKMACTGELPPNTRSGQSFVHDPKVAGETEVKAQIKLRFITGAGQPVVVIRSFQLTQRKASMAFKALDNVLQTVNRATGAREALSYRCADIDRAIPSLMGVSAAVLESVVFVHQEDSNWPLADAQAVKKRFDDIFAATRYTKALEALRKLRSEKTAEAREMRLRLDTLRSHRDGARRLRGAVEAGEDALASLEARITELQRRIETVQAEMETVLQQQAAIRGVEQQRRQLEAQHHMLSQHNSENRARLVSAYGEEDVGISLEELEEWDASLAPETQAASADAARLEQRLAQRQADVSGAKEQVQRATRRQGQLTAEAEAHARALEERDAFLGRLAAGMGLPGSQTGLRWEQPDVQRVVTACREQAAALEAQAASMRSAHASADAELSAALDAVNAELAGAAEGVRLSEGRLERNTALLHEASARLPPAAPSSAAVEEAAAHEAGLARRLAEAEGVYRVADFEAHLLACQSELATLGVRLASLRRERDRASSAGEGATRARLRRTELTRKRGEAAALLGTAAPFLAALLGPYAPAPTPSQIRAAVEAEVETRAAALAAQRGELAATQARAAELAGQLGGLRAQTEAARSELAELAGRLRRGLEGVGGGAGAADAAADAADDMAADVALCQRRLEEEKASNVHKLKTADAFLTMNERFLSTARQHNACHTCGRPFHGAGELEAFLARQERERAKLPSARGAWEAALRDAEARLARLQGLAPIAARHDRLRDATLPELEAACSGPESALATARGEAELREEGVAEAVHLLQEARGLLETVAWPADKLAAEISDLEAEIGQLSGSVQASASQASVADLDAELAALERERLSAEARREELLARQSAARELLASLAADLAAAREEALTLRAAAQRAADLAARVAELRAEGEALRAGVEEARSAHAPRLRRQARLQAERATARERARAAEEDAEAARRRAQDAVRDLEARLAAVARHDAVRGAGELERVERELQGLALRQSTLEAEVQSLREELAELEGSAAEQEKLRRQIQDLLAYRRSLSQEEGMAQELASLAQTMGAEVVLGEDGESLEARGLQLQEELARLRSKQDQSVGSLRTIRDNVQSAQTDLDEPQFQGIDTRYRKQLIELKTTELANTDLEKYHKALEKALLSFHTTKMHDINKAIKELWQQTYRSADIDYIQVKADAEGAAGRSYNYRVVMYCGGAELDMRGRCSAGQKILACLIIRLALAETFCLKCGILALDEPTTNLDAANSASLAEALRQIILSRQSQENFQLIVITHDETFARLIGIREHAEYMWRITKDENQHTLVTQEEIMS
uniref:DNA repair protein RAD50 n=1 Tax=Auxenochlorella protothecoides TaxID=3075 RepID=A0A1D2A4U2_AUXPR